MGLSQHIKIDSLKFDELHHYANLIGEAACIEAGMWDFDGDHFGNELERLYTPGGIVYTDENRNAFMGVAAARDQYTGEDCLQCQFFYVIPEARKTMLAFRFLQAVFALNSPATWYFSTGSKTMIRLLKKFGLNEYHTELKGGI